LSQIRYTGARVKRLEDPRLLRGRGRYVADITLPGMLYVAFARSPHAHARLVSVDVSAARALPGVVAVATARDLEVKPLAPTLVGGGFTPTEWPALASDHVRFAGEAIAAVVAESAYVAADARDLVVADWQPLPAIVTLDDALARDQVLVRRAASRGDVDAAFARAAVTIRETFTHDRAIASPMEPRGVLASWDGETLTLRAGTQTPRILRTAVAAALALDESLVRVIAPDVGGGFGMKMHVYPEDLVLAALAVKLGRPVRWIEERREHFLAGAQARAQRFDVEVAADESGRVLALRGRSVSDAGAYHIHPTTQALEPLGSAAILPGPYLTPAYAWEAIAVRTNKMPLGAYRGVGMTMGAFVMERALDLLARRRALDPVEVRRRNLIPHERYPFTSASGLVYDSGDYPKALEHALALADYEALRREQARAQSEGRAVGIGISCYTEFTGMGAAVFRARGMDDVPGVEAAAVTMDPDGGVRVVTSFPSQGQGHATAVAQIVADRLGVDLARVRLAPSDTDAAPLGSGTFGSRGAVAMSGTVAVAADRVRDKVVRLAAHVLEAAPADLVVADGRVHVRGAVDRGVRIADVARAAYSPPRGGLAAGEAPGLEATVYYDSGGATYSGAVHIAVVEIDRDTGRVRVVRYALVEDCGPLVNPLLVDGQIHGAVAQGLGEALLERIVHDDSGQLLTATFMDYALPRADDVPSFEIGHMETPSRLTIGSPAAIANAVADALASSGVAITALPIRAETLVQAMRR
jgi:aerobic carbon-monoxide dehydrogenase large subunit